MTTFADLGLSPKLLTALAKTNMTEPTPIQAQAIPHIMKGSDLMGLAQTGTGKTAAFGLPLLHRLLDIGHPPAPRKVRALILAPTRELVNQIAENFLTFTKGTAVKVTMVVGGASLNRQAERLARGSDVLVATPGRLIDLLERGAVSLDECGYLVLDEADHMLDMGFIHSLRKIAKYIPQHRQTLLFSAIWLTSSRVGARISARTRRGAGGWPMSSRRCRRGRPKAAVLPVPVWARPIRSAPFMMWGMACA